MCVACVGTTLGAPDPCYVRRCWVDPLQCKTRAHLARTSGRCTLRRTFPRLGPLLGARGPGPELWGTQLVWAGRCVGLDPMTVSPGARVQSPALPQLRLSLVNGAVGSAELRVQAAELQGTILKTAGLLVGIHVPLHGSRQFLIRMAAGQGVPSFAPI